MSERQISPVGGGFVIRFLRGACAEINHVGQYLEWVGGRFVLCGRREDATGFQDRSIARTVALRAESAYPGARFEVVPKVQGWSL